MRGLERRGEKFISRPPGHLEGGGGSFRDHQACGGWGWLKRRGRSSFKDHQAVQVRRGGGGGGRDGRSSFRDHKASTGGRERRGEVHSRTTRPVDRGESEGEKFIPGPPGL